MYDVTLVLGLLVAVITLATAARKVGVPYPIVLVLGGLALGLAPGLPQIALRPELVFVLFQRELDLEEVRLPPEL